MKQNLRLALHIMTV